MNTKKERREAAQKKSKIQKMVLLVVLVVGLTAAGVLLAVYMVTRPSNRVFAVPMPFPASGQHSVTLYEDGRFTARLFHQNNFNGTFVEDEVTGMVTFTHRGNVTTGQIDGDELLLPVPWRGTCRLHSHEIAFPRVR